MAKGQQRSNREVKKPKASKPAVASEAASAAKKIVTQVSAPKKKD